MSELNQKWEELHIMACNLIAMTANDESYTDTKEVYLELAEKIAVETSKLNVEGEEVQKHLADLYWDVLSTALEKYSNKKGFNPNKGNLRQYVLGGHKQLKAQAIREASIIPRPSSMQSKLNQVKKMRRELEEKVDTLKGILRHRIGNNDNGLQKKQLEEFEQKLRNLIDEKNVIENKGKTSSFDPNTIKSEDVNNLAHDSSPLIKLVEEEEKGLGKEISRKGCDVVFHILSNANYMAGFGLSQPNMNFVEDANLGQIGKEVLKTPLFIRDYLFTSPEYLSQNSVSSNINEGSNLLDIRQWAIRHSKELNLA